MNIYNNNCTGIVVAKVAELQRNQNILYNLVRPNKDEPNLVESNLKLANVLPKKRIYRMTSSRELELFKTELLTRPLLLQCTIDTGPGVGCFSQLSKYDCRFVENSECFIVLLNQIHPKILSRLSMGLDLAIKYMQQSQPFILTFTFNKTIEKLYSNILRAYDIQLGRREKVSCNYAELIIRYIGRNTTLRITDTIKVRDLKFSFEDLDKDDLLVDTQATAAARQRRSLPIDQGELVSVLKGWKFGDFELSNGLWNAYAEITGAPLRQNNCTPPPTYEKAVLNAISETDNSRSPYHNQYRCTDYGYMETSTRPSTSVAVVHSSSEKNVQQNMNSRMSDVNQPAKKVIKPLRDLEPYRGYAYSDPEPVGDTIYNNYGYSYSTDNSPETEHQIAAQELGSNQTDNFRFDQKKPTSGEAYEYGYVTDSHDINFTPNLEVSKPDDYNSCFV